MWQRGISPRPLRFSMWETEEAAAARCLTGCPQPCSSLPCPCAGQHQAQRPVSLPQSWGSVVWTALLGSLCCGQICLGGYSWPAAPDPEQSSHPQPLPLPTLGSLLSGH